MGMPMAMPQPDCSQFGFDPVGNEIQQAQMQYLEMMGMIEPNGMMNPYQGSGGEGQHWKPSQSSTVLQEVQADAFRDWYPRGKRGGKRNGKRLRNSLPKVRLPASLLVISPPTSPNMQNAR
jgi:hypothetical protein